MQYYSNSQIHTSDFRNRGEESSRETGQSSSREQSRAGEDIPSASGAGAPPEGDDRRGGYWAVGSWPAGRPFEASMWGGGRAGQRPGRS